MAKTHTSKIQITVGLDDNRIPEKLYWTAQDGGVSNEEAKAVMPVSYTHLTLPTICSV